MGLVWVGLVGAIVWTGESVRECFVESLFLAEFWGLWVGLGMLETRGVKLERKKSV
jgi:hypothetical protein